MKGENVMRKWIKNIYLEMREHIQEDPTVGLIFVTPIGFGIVFAILIIAHYT